MRRQLRGALFRDPKPCPEVSIPRLGGPLFFDSVDHLKSEFRWFEAM